MRRSWRKHEGREEDGGPERRAVVQLPFAPNRESINVSVADIPSPRGALFINVIFLMFFRLL